MIILNKTYGFTSGQLAAPQANAWQLSLNR